MESDNCISENVPSGNVSVQPDDELRNRLALMRHLQASLCGSHRALLAMDLIGIEQRTSEQVILSRMLAEEVRRSRESPASGRTTSANCNSSFSRCTPELKDELRQSEFEVLGALRLQAALLMRARRKLRVLSNMLADPSISYGPLLLQRQAHLRASDFKSGGEI